MEQHYFKEIETPAGTLAIQGPVSSKVLQLLDIDQSLKAFRPPSKQKKALIEISELQKGFVIIASLSQTIIGYVTFHPPDDFERWSIGPKETLELGAIEVAPMIRKYNVGKTLLDVAFLNPIMENHLIIVTEYYWHWDLEGTGLTIWEYRDIMKRLMSYAGMVVKHTDDEEISSHPANLFMVRYGKNLSQHAMRNFEKILFLGPDSYGR